MNPNIMMKGNDHKRQILLSYFENDEPINELTFSRTKTKEIKIEDNEKILRLENNKRKGENE